MNINIKPDCGNSPKMAFIKKLNIAYAEADVETIMSMVTEDIVLDIVGDHEVVGYANFREIMETIKDHPTKEFTVESIITHGREGAAIGSLKLKDGRSLSYADHYIFSNAKAEKIKSIKSFVILR